MPAPASSMPWEGALAWFAVIALASFLVTFVFTDLFHVGRTWYVGLLALVTGALTWGYLAWSGTDVMGYRMGWTSGAAGKLGVGVLAVVGSLVVIGVHHLGYREFRGRAIVYPFAGCMRFTLAYLFTASPIAPMVGHIGLHAAIGAKGLQLPPYAVSAEAPRTLRRAA